MQFYNEALTFYRDLCYTLIEKPPRTIHIPRTIASFTDEECGIYFRMNKSELYRIFKAFKIPNVITLSSRSKFVGEELLLFCLMRYFHGINMELQSRLLFGRENSQWSRAFDWFNKHMVNEFAYLLIDNMVFWLPHFPKFANKIRLKIEEKSQLFYQHGTFQVFAFVDDNVSKICRPAGGPADEGENAPRYNNDIQRAFFNK